ncbi:LysR substrate-binding domain-containing protein [Marinomonas sp. PE14-40]|uniref:LysR substrate-binding domain-containing protein n=1 Tax=Marinomonas sp. PE14-40 TaxID=3060621 RepID=UPI003F67BD2C
MNKLHAMNTFVQICESGSLTKAAEALDTSLPTVVRTLASLEEHLNTRLFNRTTRKITLTEEGHLYLSRCRRILFDIEDAELELNSQQSKPSGKLTITAPVNFGNQQVSPLVNQFLKQHDQIKIDLLLGDKNINLVEESIDVAIRIGPLADSSMVAKNVGHVRRVICASPRFLNNYPYVKTPKDLLKLPCIRFSPLSHGGNWNFYQGDKVLSIKVDGPLYCTEISAMRQAVLDDIGVGIFLSYQVQAQLDAGTLVPILTDYEPEPLPVSVVYSHAKLMSSRVRVFVDWMTLNLKEQMDKTKQR